MWREANPIQTLEDLEGAFASGVRENVSAFYISGETLIISNLSRVIPLVAASGKPSAGVYAEWTRAGLLMSYSGDVVDGYSEIAGSGWRGGTSTVAGDSGSAGSGKRGGSGIPFARKSHAAWDA